MKNSGGGDAVFLIFMLVMVGATVIGLLIQVLFLMTLSRCLSRVRPYNRDMDPGAVWLNLIPLFGLIWMFITVGRIASSLQKEYRDRDWRASGESFGQSVGMAYLTCALLGVIPLVGPFCTIAAIICFIIYWIQIADYSSRLLAPAPSVGRREDDDYGRDRERRYDGDDYDSRWNRRDREDRDRDYRDRDEDDRDRDYDYRRRRD